MEVGADVAGTLVEEISGRDVSPAEVLDGLIGDCSVAGIELTGSVE